MRRKPAISLLFIGVFLFFTASVFFHVSREFLPSADLNSAALRRPHTSLAVRELLDSPPPPLDAILLPDWEVLLLLPPDSSSSSISAAEGSLFCLFHTGAASPARHAGASAFRCALPRRLRRIRPFFAPRLSADFAAAGHDFDFAPREMIRWSMSVAYESFSTDDDVIVFAKGINRRKDSIRSAADIKCVFIPASGGPALAATPATSSSQEVFRCPHPSVPLLQPLRVSLAVAPEAAPIATVAEYRSPSLRDRPPSRGRVAVCACTMVFNAAKFLPEWVAYHAGVGVERFFLYDNASEDELEPVVSRLGSVGFDVVVRTWPWPKTQEAGFSHCAVSNQDECDWMAPPPRQSATTGHAVSPAAPAEEDGSGAAGRAAGVAVARSAASGGTPAEDQAAVAGGQVPGGAEAPRGISGAAGEGTSGGGHRPLPAPDGILLCRPLLAGGHHPLLALARSC